jgi:brefeldin A-inhibited guanine nucleotide-exchange protein
MASDPEATSGDSRLSQLLIPTYEKIIKNASWRKGHSKLSQQCKSLIDKLSSSPAAPASPHPPSPNSSSALPGPLRELSLADSETFLSPLISALNSGSSKIVEPALDCVQKLVSHSYLHGEADPLAGPDARLLAQVVEGVCKCHQPGSTGEEVLELLVLKTLLSAVTSTSLRIHGDSLLHVVRTCYDLYLGSKNQVNQTTAKASLIQMLVIVFRRMEADSSTVPVQPIVVAEMMEPSDRTGSGMPAATANDVNFVQGFITKIIGDIDVVLNPSMPLARSSSATGNGAHDGAFETTTVETTNAADLLDSTDKDMLDAKYWEISMYKTALEGRKDELGVEGSADRDDDLEVQIGNKLRRDAFLVFRALCKLSMKTPPKEAAGDPTLMKGKIVALELLKILLENAGAVFRTSDR